MSKKYYYVIKDRKGNLMVGSKVCGSKAGCKNSYNSLINGELYSRAVSNDPFWQVQSLANEDHYGCPRIVDDIDAFLDHAHNVNNYYGNNIVKEDVLGYNELVRELTYEWQIEEVEVI